MATLFLSVFMFFVDSRVITKVDSAFALTANNKTKTTYKITKNFKCT